jgi:catechol 2,3-dioxygenase-like lactoylglutathione lyase family enzyme
MPIKGFSHVAIGVSDMERALGFYCGVLGLEVLHDLGETLEMDEGGTVPRRGVYLTWPGDTTQSLIVLDTQDRKGAQPSPRGFHDLGLHHFGFWVDDEIEAIYQRAIDAGCPIVQSLFTMPADQSGNPTGEAATTALFRDPDGNIIQLDGIKPSSSLARVS